MPAEDYKALTHINLPFVDEGHYAPGEMIPYGKLVESCEQASKLVGSDGQVPTADEMIEDLMKWGSISDDPDADLHPQHRPVSFNRPTLSRLVEMAQQLIEDLESEDEEVPAKLRALAGISHKQVEAVDGGLGGDNAQAE